MWNGRVYDFVCKLEKIFDIKLSHLEKYLHSAPENVIDDILLIDFKNYVLNNLNDSEILDEFKKRNLIYEIEEDYRLKFSPNLKDASTLELVEELRSRGI